MTSEVSCRVRAIAFIALAAGSIGGVESPGNACSMATQATNIGPPPNSLGTEPPNRWVYPGGQELCSPEASGWYFWNVLASGGPRYTGFCCYDPSYGCITYVYSSAELVDNVTECRDGEPG